jgi:hypothetical protein
VIKTNLPLKLVADAAALQNPQILILNCFDSKGRDHYIFNLEVGKGHMRGSKQQKHRVAAIFAQWPV